MVDPTNLSGMLDFVIDTAYRAGELLREAYDRPRHISYKGEVNLVTETDIAVEELIIGTLREAYPEIGVLAEESGESGENGSLRWLIDPLDGTNNFAHALPVFCTSIALRDTDGPLLGVIYDPLRDECFSAVRGQGAAINGKPIHVSDAPKLLQGMLGTGFPYVRQTTTDNNAEAVAHFLRRAQGIRRMGSAAIDLAYVACGRLDGYWEWGINPWDVTAGILLVQEAGGKLSTYAGGPIDELQMERMNVVASNGHIHGEMLDTLADVYDFGENGDFTLKGQK